VDSARRPDARLIDESRVRNKEPSRADDVNSEEDIRTGHAASWEQDRLDAPEVLPSIDAPADDTPSLA
jgi:hypothetical protein